MKRKFKQILAAISAAAMFFTTTAVLPEKIPYFGGITAIAEETGHAEKQATDVVSVTIDGIINYYADITAAWDAAKGNTAYVTLLQDADIGSTKLLVNKNSDITLDCGGYTLTGRDVYTIGMIGGSLTVKNGTVTNTTYFSTTITLGGSSPAVLTVESGAVIKSDKGEYGISFNDNSSVNIYGTVQSVENGVYALEGTLNVYPGAVISGDKYGIKTSSYYESNIFLYGGTIYGGENAIYRNQKGTINVAEDMTAKLDDVVLTSPITESTSAGTISLTCSGAHTFYNTALDTEGNVTCAKCPAKALAMAKMENDGTTYYVGESSLDSVFADSSNDGATITLLTNVDREDTLIIKINCTLDLNQHTIHTTGDYEPGIWFYGWTNVTIQGEGEVISDNSHALNVMGIVTLEGGTFTGNGKNFCGVYVNSEEAELYVNGENVTIQNASDDIGLGVNAVKSVQLTAGTIRTIKILYYDKLVTLGDLLGHTESTRYAYFDGNTPITDKLGETSLTGTVTVKECDHSVETYTNNNDGTHKIFCHACGKDENETHNISKAEAKSPTCVENGNIEYWHCSECEKYFSDEACASETTLEDTVIEAAGHNYQGGKCSSCGMFEDGIGRLSGASLSLSGNIGVNFFMELDESVIADENAYMQFTLPNGDKPQVMVSDAKAKDGCYVFSCEVSAKEMDSKITAQMITSNGEGTVYEYSVKEYADSVSENQSNFDEKTINLVNAMANYGDYAKAYFGGETLAATPEMDNITADILAGYEKRENGVLPSGVTYYGSSLILESNTTLRHYFKVADGTDVSQCNFSGSKGNYCCIDIADIAAGSLFDTHITTIGDYTIEYGPMTYVQTVLNNDSADEALKNTLKALYLYGQSAQAYMN